MLKKVTSVLLAVSFVVVVISGISMMSSKSGIMHPLHEFFGVVMIITGIIHLIINFKSLVCYLKIKSVNIIFCSTVALIVILLIIAANVKHADRGGDYNKYHDEIESYNR